MPRLRPFHTLVQPISPASTALTDARMDRMGVGCGVSPQCRETFEKASSEREGLIYATPPLDARGIGASRPFGGLDMVVVGDGWTLRLERRRRLAVVCRSWPAHGRGRTAASPRRHGRRGGIRVGPLLVTEAVLTGPGGGPVPAVDGGVRRRGFRGTQRERLKRCGGGGSMSTRKRSRYGFSELHCFWEWGVTDFDGSRWKQTNQSIMHPKDVGFSFLALLIFSQRRDSPSVSRRTIFIARLQAVKRKHPRGTKVWAWEETVACVCYSTQWK
ncbi:hypothetical protein B0T18DRAFT_222591 [Schizothecium vesticola]|uniref:Uncharacterized protein n=1 Tax=Schizothecium vesticola TaxID=314040 RepID=A0AA40EKI0_9PEZI|nr:hypothetical protein B0T18DRAFT_222591 [Schizothecium vesticola]